MVKHKRKSVGKGSSKKSKSKASVKSSKSSGESHKGKRVVGKPVNPVDLRTVAILVFLVAVVALGVYFLSSGSVSEGSVKQVAYNQQVPTYSGPANVSQDVVEQMKVLADDDPVLGSESAPVTIVEFSDFQCPFCARFRAQTFDRIKENFTDKGLVKFVYRDLPLSFHQYAQKAAEAAQCAHEQGKFWEYHDLLFKNQRSLDVNSLKKYAADLGLDVDKFSECLDSGKYADEIAKDAQDAASLGISGTPGFVINGQVLVGAQPYREFERIICQFVPESDTCKNVEPPVTLEVTVVNDERCGASCDAMSSQLKAAIKNLFPGAVFTDIDASSDEGKSLIEKYNLVFAPSFLFSEELVDTYSWKNNERLRSAFIKTDDGYRLRDEATGASWYFSDEMRREAEQKLMESLDLNLSDGKPQVDFFVMSFCPYGNQAEALLKPVFDKLKGKAYFRPHYVIYNQGSGCYTDSDGTKLCSLHGSGELNQDIREMCVYDLYGEQGWFDFALAINDQCNSKNADSCWSPVAEYLGFDVDKIHECFEENKVSYARKEFELNKLLGVTGSPTVFFEGKEYNGPRKSNDYLSALCQGFSDEDRPAACDSVINESAAASSAGAAPVGSCG